jgi:hypothetical protein
LDEVTCGDFYEGSFLNSCKSGIGSYTYGTAKAKYIGRRARPRASKLKALLLSKFLMR